MSEFKLGQYVRCPIDSSDQEDPRIFALGQIVEVNSVAGTVSVIFNDPFNYKNYYEDIPKKKVTYFTKKIVRCKIHTNSHVLLRQTKLNGIIISQIADADTVYYSYYVQVNDASPSKSNIRKYNELELIASFNHMDYNPLKQLAAYELHNPSWYRSRVHVSNVMHILENAIFGFKILAGCRVFLMPHQIYTIVRCLEDKPIRFLLADEVGLGKTIEACSVIKILKSQYHKLRVLLIIPNSLVDQWKTELLYKFNISAQIFDSSAQESDSIIVPLEELNQCRKKIESLQAFDFCIVDESHRLLALPQEYLAVKEISKRISNILLLSATPVQENKEEYLSLLTLLHPEQYENMAIEYFVELLSKQQEIQRRVYSILGDLEEYDDYYEEIIEELSSIANKINDSTFLALVERISVDLPDKGLDAAQLSVAYLCEHYRIERRVIRNRREAIREKLPERDMIAVPYEMVGSEVFYYEENTYELVLSWIQSIDAFDKDKVLGVVTLIAGLLLFSDW